VACSNNPNCTGFIQDKTTGDYILGKIVLPDGTNTPLHFYKDSLVQYIKVMANVEQVNFTCGINEGYYSIFMKIIIECLTA
jgi:hypothetical protein